MALLRFAPPCTGSGVYTTPCIPAKTGGSGGTAFTTYFYLLSDDGRVAWDSALPQTPDGDIRRCDFDGNQLRTGRLGHL
jgi:hypothetical protein